MLRVAIVVLAAMMFGCGGKNWTEQDAAAAVRSIAQDRLDRDPASYGQRPGARVTRMVCVREEGRVFRCVGELDSGESFSAVAHVSEDGERLVTEGP